MTEDEVGKQQEYSEQVPILNRKMYSAPSVFSVENLLREARRQKGLEDGQVPTICVLDPDGDLVDALQATGRLHAHATWACYHTTLSTFLHEEIEYGISFNTHSWGERYDRNERM